MKCFDLSGKVAMVTGGSRGIGAGITHALAEAGADVIVVYRARRDDAEKLQRTIRQSGRRCDLIRHDLADLAGIPTVVAEAVHRMDRLDILVNNAGMADLVPFDKVTVPMFERTLRVNTLAPFFLAQAAARYMIDNHIRGRIINIGSTNGLVAEALLAPYNASKGALELVTKSLAIELGPYGITVNTVDPGLIDTEIGENFDLDDAFRKYAVEHIPLGRYGTSEECAGAVVYLAGEAGRYVTGQHIVIDGGLTADQFPRMQFFRDKAGH